MVAAGEPEEAIGAVIQRLSAAPAPAPSLWERANTPLTTLPSRIAAKGAEVLDRPSVTRSPDTARLSGFLAGALQGTGDVASSFTSPLSLGLGALGPGLKGLRALRSLHALSPQAATVGRRGLPIPLDLPGRARTPWEIPAEVLPRGISTPWKSRGMPSSPKLRLPPSAPEIALFTEPVVPVTPLPSGIQTPWKIRGELPRPQSSTGGLAPRVPRPLARMPQEATIARPAPSRPLQVDASALGPAEGFTPAAQRAQMATLTRHPETGRATTAQAVNQAIQRERRQAGGVSPTGAERRQPIQPGTTLGIYAKPGAGSAKQVIRPGSTTVDLLTEKLQESIPGAKVTRINQMPKPQGATELDRAIRQRGHIDETMRKRQGLGSERGAVMFPSKAELKTGLSRANELRVGSMLSGMAIPKNILGGAGASLATSLEQGSATPLKEMLRLPTNLRIARTAFREGANPSAISGPARMRKSWNLPGRVIGAIDESKIQELTRAGVPAEDIQRVMLSNPAGTPTQLKGPVGRALVPFQRTPFNQLWEGISPANWATKRPTTPTFTGQPRSGGDAGWKFSPRRTALSLGYMGGGAAAGHAIDESKMSGPQKLLATGALGAFATSRAVPTLIAAGLGGLGKPAVSGLSPLPEWGFPATWKQLAGVTTGLPPSAVRTAKTIKGEKTPTRRRRARSKRTARGED